MDRKVIQNYKALITLGLPIVIGQLGVIVLSIADTMMVGRYGTDELAAASFVNNMFNLIIVTATGFSYGITPVVGRLFGRGEKAEAGGVLKNAVVANGLLAMVFIALMSVLYLCLGRLGAPVALQMGMETASFSLSTIMVGWLGTTALAAHQVMLTIGQLGFMVYYGMAAAVAVRASAFCGQGDKEAVKMTVSGGFHIILVLAAAVSVLMLAVRGSVGYLFTDNADVADAVAMLVIPFVLYQFGDGMQSNYANALRGISDVKMLSVYAFVAYFLISLPAGWLFGFVCGWGLTGIWMAFPVGLTAAGAMYMMRFRRTIARM